MSKNASLFILYIFFKGPTCSNCTIFKNKVFLQLGSVRPYETVKSFVNLGRLELTYRAKTFSLL